MPGYNNKMRAYGTKKTPKKKASKRSDSPSAAKKKLMDMSMSKAKMAAYKRAKKKVNGKAAKKKNK